MLNEEFILGEWVPALLSGDYKQGQGTLEWNNEYCCLGVACSLLEKKGILIRDEIEVEVEGQKPIIYRSAKSPDGDFDSSFLPRVAAHYIGIGISGELTIEGQSYSLSELNDEGKTFGQIAQIIKEATENRTFTSIQEFERFPLDT